MRTGSEPEILPDYKDSVGIPAPVPIRIGLQFNIKPLVTPEEIKGHLHLLELFQDLQETVENAHDRRLPEWSKQLSAEVRWAWFMNLAVERYVILLPYCLKRSDWVINIRFERWVVAQRRTRDDRLQYWFEERLPPLDVLMILHAFLLNPR